MLKFAKSFSDAWPIAAGIFALGVMAQPVAAMTAAEDACIDRLRAVGGPDGRSGTVLSSRGS
jgi:hypothetical protein